MHNLIGWAQLPAPQPIRRAFRFALGLAHGKHDAAIGAELVEAHFFDSLPLARCKHNLIMWFVYILLCSDGSFYTGISDNPRQRFSDHKNGKGGRYTRSHKPTKIIYLEKLASKSEALKRERQIKGWSREKKIRILKLENLA